jgi:hypothetical protein
VRPPARPPPDSRLPHPLRLHGAVTEQRRPAPAGAGAADRRSDVLALGSFVVLGLPDGILGTAWPSMRATFGAPVGDLGLILLLGTAGSVLVTAFVGTLIQRLAVLGPALTTLALLVVASELILTRLAPAPTPARPGPPRPDPGSPRPRPAPARRPPAALDRIPGRLGHVLSPRRRGPPYVSIRELLGVPAGMLLEPVVMAAFRRVVVKTTHVKEPGPPPRKSQGVKRSAAAKGAVTTASRSGQLAAVQPVKAVGQVLQAVSNADAEARPKDQDPGSRLRQQ